MDVEILSERENPLLGRKEVKFRVKYPGSGTVKREEVKSKIVALLDSKKELTVLDHVKPEFGRHSSVGYVKVYESEVALKAEAKHILKRNFEVKKKEGAEEKPAEEKPAEEKPAEEKPAEAPVEEKPEEKKAEEKPAEEPKEDK